MKYTIYLFTILLFFSSCCSKKNATASIETKEEKTEQKELTDEERVDAIAEQMKDEKMPNQSQDYYDEVNKKLTDDVFAKFQKTPCFGKCPIYIMTIYNDGRVEYYGKKFVEKVGSYRTTVSKEELQSLKEKAVEIGFFELENTYDNSNVTDLPSVITTIRNEEGFKTVVNRYEGPKQLNDFERYIEEYFNNLKWEKVN